MPEPLPYYYDPKRPASEGRWKVIKKGEDMVYILSYPTEFAARKAAGLTGGNTNPQYRPERV